MKTSISILSSFPQYIQNHHTYLLLLIFFPIVRDIMNISTSELSSGCESGWTMYLNQSSNSQENDLFQYKSENIIRYSNNKPTGSYLNSCDEEDEDLSMVSDASSGPPYFGVDNEYCIEETSGFRYEENKRNMKNKTKEKKIVKKEQYLYLDDTASSPIKNHMVIPSSGASMKHSTYYKDGNSAFQKHIGISQSSMSKESGSGTAGYLQGQKWE